MENTKFFTIIFFNNEKKAFKYRNIKNNQLSINRFITFAISKDAIEMNLYDKNTKQFIKKIVF